jgi:hypothetical protein
MRRYLPLGLIAVALAAGAVPLLLGDTADPVPRTAAPLAADPAHTPPAATRVVLVSRTMPAPSAPGGVLHAALVGGRMPARPMSGVVLTDTECVPDAAGISHCRNEIELENGRTLTLRHPHDMSVVPCLSPGEPVRVRRA